MKGGDKVQKTSVSAKSGHYIPCHDNKYMQSCYHKTLKNLFVYKLCWFDFKVHRMWTTSKKCILQYSTTKLQMQSMINISCITLFNQCLCCLPHQVHKLSLLPYGMEPGGREVVVAFSQERNCERSK